MPPNAALPLPPPSTCGKASLQHVIQWRKPACSWVFGKNEWELKWMKVCGKEVEMDGDENPSGRGQSHPTTRNNLLPRKGSHSAAWKYFGFKSDDDKQCEVHCKVSFTLIAAQHGNATNLYNHLKRHHKVQHDEAVQGKKQTQTGRRLAQLVECAPHVPRLCSGPGFDSRPGSLCCVSLPLSLSLCLPPCFLSYLQLYFQ